MHTRRRSDRRFQRGAEITDPDEDSLTTGADDGTVAFMILNSCLTEGSWFNYLRAVVKTNSATVQILLSV